MEIFTILRLDKAMRYSLIIEHKDCDPTYINGLKKWNEVTDYLVNKLDQWTIRVQIFKFSSDERVLGENCVTMGNLVKVATSSTDKVIAKL